MMNLNVGFENSTQEEILPLCIVLMHAKVGSCSTNACWLSPPGAEANCQMDKIFNRWRSLPHSLSSSLAHLSPLRPNDRKSNSSHLRSLSVWEREIYSIQSPLKVVFVLHVQSASPTQLRCRVVFYLATAAFTPASSTLSPTQEAGAE